MKRAPVILLITLVCVMIYTESKALSALIIGTNKAVVSGYTATGTVSIRVMQDNVDLGILPSPFFIADQGGNYTVVGGLTKGKVYKFQVISNGVTTPWSNPVTSL